jgi:tRNA(Ile)-lysidine synthase
VPSAASEWWVERFRSDCAALIGVDEIESARFGIAVSGGPDSMALLWLAAQALPGHVWAATVDHQLRSDARAEAEMVEHWCETQTISHAILTPNKAITGSIQSAARAVRYALLEDWRVTHNLDWIMTAHHADDQLETLLMLAGWLECDRAMERFCVRCFAGGGRNWRR